VQFHVLHYGVADEEQVMAKFVKENAF
jgi:hypothetical protein